jgi:hypothetical protein
MVFCTENILQESMVGESSGIVPIPEIAPELLDVVCGLLIIPLFIQTIAA